MPDYDSMSMNEIYQLDANERIKVLNQHILTLEKETDNFNVIEDVIREAHSLKAASRIVNHSDVQKLSHKIEDIFISVKGEKKEVSSSLTDLILSVLDVIENMIQAFLKEEPCSEDASKWEKLLEEAKSGNYSVSNEIKKEKPKEEKNNVSVQKEPVSLEGTSTIRIGTEKLDKLVNLSGELYTNILNLERSSAEEKRLLAYLAELMIQFDSISSLSGNGDFDPSKVKSWLSKNGAWLKEYYDKASIHSDIFSRISVQLNHLGTQLQDEVMQSRMLPASTLFGPYQRFVRDISKELGKKIKLEVEGEETQIDRSVLELLKDPFMHLIRNSCDHGLETEEERLKQGKAPEGTLKLSASHQAGRVIVTVEDDGGGIDLEKIKKQILEKNLISEEKFNRISRKELINFIFVHSFSTASEVTETSGRGVGLDVVKSQLNEIGGTIQVETERKRYTRFILSLPLTLSVVKTLLVEIGGEVFCLPLTRISEVIQIDENKLETIEGKNVIRVREDVLPLVQANQFWGYGQSFSDSKKGEAVILGEGTEKIAFKVDKLLYEKEIVSKTLDSRLAYIEELSGATVLDNGQVAFIVNIDTLLKSTVNYQDEINFEQEVRKKVENRKKILIVEDSLTVRELEKSVLKGQGFDVETAVDGMDGYVKLKEQSFDLVVTDVEMPRMTGLELIGVMKKEESLSRIPTIIVSYRESIEDKRKGMEVGADRYLVKSKYDNKVLLSAIDQLIGVA